MKQLQLVFKKCISLAERLFGGEHQISLEGMNDLKVYLSDVKILARQLLVAVSLYILVYFLGYLLYYDEFQIHNLSVLGINSNPQGMIQFLSLYPWNFLLLSFLYLILILFSIIVHYIILLFMEKVKHLWKSLLLVHLQYLRILFLFTTVLYIINRIQTSWKLLDSNGFNFLITFCIFLIGIFWAFKWTLNSTFSKSPFQIPKHRTNFVWGLITLLFILIGYGQI